VAYATGGDDRLERGLVSEAIPFYQKALQLEPISESALVSFGNALKLAGRAAEAESVARQAIAAHPASGPAQNLFAEASWCAGHGLAQSRAALEAARVQVRAEDRYQVDLSIADLAWTAGDTTRALAACDSVLAYQSDNPSGLQGRAETLALAGRSDEALSWYEKAVRMRTGIADLRCAFARDLLRAGRVDAARAQLAEVQLLDEENPTAEALRAWADLAGGDLASARTRVRRALEWGPWCDLAVIVAGAVEAGAGKRQDAEALWSPLQRRMAGTSGPGYVYRSKIARWERIHTLPAMERAILAGFQSR
jgi:tetratricopeptide (TPR) repeat protein